VNVGLDVNWAVRWLTLSAQAMAEHRVELIDLDRPIGDSDHGENMNRGFEAVLAKLAEAPPETAAAALKLTAMTLMSKVGGAAGPLYGTAFLRAATALGDTADVDAAALAGALQAARDGIVARGKAESGDKTMVDAWTPAVEAATAAAGGGDVRKVLAEAATAAEAGAVATDPMLARKGRASYLGERSVGHRDPGAVSSALILRAAAVAAE
jgi:dihydroxyacetone kinase-like protein